MMHFKKLIRLIFVTGLGILLAACGAAAENPPAGGLTSTGTPEVMEASGSTSSDADAAQPEEDAAEPAPDEDVPPASETEEEPEPMPEQEDEDLPVSGSYQAVYGAGTLECPGPVGTVEIPSTPPDSLTLEFASDGQTITVQGFSSGLEETAAVDTPLISLERVGSEGGVSHYTDTINVEGVGIVYNLYHAPGAGDAALYGDIQTTDDSACTVYREYTLVLAGAGQ